MDPDDDQDAAGGADDMTSGSEADDGSVNDLNDSDDDDE